MFLPGPSKRPCGALRDLDGIGCTGDSANSGPTIGQRVSKFFSQAMRSFGVFDNFVPSRESFESGVQQLLGGPCEYNCAAHNIILKSTADVMQGAAQGVAEAANRYYPELVKNALLTAVPEMALAKMAVAPVEKFSEYIFKEGATHGKDAVFRGLGYDGSHSAELAEIWSRQAAAKFASWGQVRQLDTASTVGRLEKPPQCWHDGGQPMGT